MPTQTPNAFATGRNPSHAAVAVTEGIVRILDRRELEGVLAHEISHVRNRDILISTIAASVAGLVSALGHAIQWGAWLGLGRSSDDDRGGSALGALAWALLAPIIGLMLAFVFGDYLSQLLPSAFGPSLCAFMAVVALTTANLMGTQKGAWTQNALTAAKVIGLFSVLLAGLAFSPPLPLPGTGSPPAEWNVESGKNILWKTAIPGLGHSSPVIWGDRIFVTTAVPASGESQLKVGLYGDVASVKGEPAQSFRVYCLDRGSGKILWERTATAGMPKIMRHPKSTHANPTPATDGKRLLVRALADAGTRANCHEWAARLAARDAASPPEKRRSARLAPCSCRPPSPRCGPCRRRAHRRATGSSSARARCS